MCGNRKRKTLQIARICRFQVHRNQNTPGKANLRFFRDFSGYFQPFGNPHTFPIKLNIKGHTNTMCRPPVTEWKTVLLPIAQLCSNPPSNIEFA